MKNHHITSPSIPIDFDAAIWRAAVVADELLGDNMLPGSSLLVTSGVSCL